MEHRDACDASKKAPGIVVVGIERGAFEPRQESERAFERDHAGDLVGGAGQHLVDKVGPVPIGATAVRKRAFIDEPTGYVPTAQRHVRLHAERRATRGELTQTFASTFVDASRLGNEVGPGNAQTDVAAASRRQTRKVDQSTFAFLV
ncbi:MAG: hypothetical protein FGM42_03605 [Ilumatobacteraceae bacterium]|nr:hypothetical protein [Ilumatobacteraceae bacterium]